MHQAKLGCQIEWHNPTVWGNLQLTFHPRPFPNEHETFKLLVKPTTIFLEGRTAELQLRVV